MIDASQAPPRPGQPWLLDVVLGVMLAGVGLAAVHWGWQILVFAAGLILLLGLLSLVTGLDLLSSILSLVFDVGALAGIGVWGLLARCRLSLVVVIGVVAWGAAWHSYLSPAAKTRRIVDRVVHAVDDRVQAGEALPDKDIAAWLDVDGADPYKLSRHAPSGDLRDAWGRRLVYRKGVDGAYHLYSRGADGDDDDGRGDDYGHVEPLGTLSERIKDSAVDGAADLGRRLIETMTDDDD